MMQKALKILGTLRNPVYWTLITGVFVAFGLPPQVVAAIGTLIDTSRY